MECENVFCVYQEKDKCILDEICIDNIGLCCSCICVDIPDEELVKYKILHRNKIENY